MTAKLARAILREVTIESEQYTVSLSDKGVRIAKKRMRSGAFYTWRQLWQGEPRAFAVEQSAKSGGK